MSLPQRVIVTGAAQGIGRAVALRLASPGVYLALWDVKREGVEDTAKLCCEKGAQSRALAIDVGDASAIEAAVAGFEEEWGKPDGLVNNAGIFPRARALDMKLAEWDQVLRVNLTGTFAAARAVAARMKEAGRGAIVNTASGRALGRRGQRSALRRQQGGNHRINEIAGARLGRLRHPCQLRHSGAHRHGTAARRNGRQRASCRWRAHSLGPHRPPRGYCRGGSVPAQ
jgi:NAD(P)-dependent dehydrogenase (short-subunit alcohol dehydrogenase family)